MFVRFRTLATIYGERSPIDAFFGRLVVYSAVLDVVGGRALP